MAKASVFYKFSLAYIIRNFFIITLVEVFSFRKIFTDYTIPRTKLNVIITTLIGNCRCTIIKTPFYMLSKIVKIWSASQEYSKV